jgi:hypothetical protein
MAGTRENAVLVVELATYAEHARARGRNREDLRRRVRSGARQARGACCANRAWLQREGRQAREQRPARLGPRVALAVDGRHLGSRGGRTYRRHSSHLAAQTCFVMKWLRPSSFGEDAATRAL